MISLNVKDLVCTRNEYEYGYTNLWWEVMFIDDNGTFVGMLQRKPLDYRKHTVGEHVTIEIDDIKAKYQGGEQFCYSDNVSICDCKGLCRNK